MFHCFSCTLLLIFPAVISIRVVGISLGRTVVCTRPPTRSYCVHSFRLGGCARVCARSAGHLHIIPGWVPLKRLPAASGLALLISGLFTYACAPFVCLIRDHPAFPQHVFSFIAAISWSLETLVRRYRRRCRGRKRNCVT
ncbi:uncharacterized protein LOC114804373 [Zeugodacus cucurbitae]|uniref:uncharacterized protein LOC114804373 n=1 Tax=Zeugodacus cucurbitae TaxID=28588 RepID=UPI0023D8FFC8|nr:uncharacterized protein LOC114804373 [Zeugodacus cucurbitae]